MYFSNLRYNFSLYITKLLREQNVQEHVANSIPVIPVGLVSQPQIKSDRRDISWVDDFWETVFGVLKASRQEQARVKTEDTDSW